MVIFKDPVAKLELSKKARVLVVFLVLGLVLTCAIPLMVDAELTRRRSRPGSRGPAQSTRGGAKGWLPVGRPAGARPSASASDKPAERVLTYGTRARQAAEQPSPQQVPEHARPGGDAFKDEAEWPYKNWPAAPAGQERAPGTSAPAGNGGPAGDVEAGPPGSSLPVWR
jgi:hypothetical protein